MKKNILVLLLAVVILSGVSAIATTENPLLGKLGEFSLPTENLDESIKFWKDLGFSIKGKYTKPYPWAILADGQILLGLHQTDQYNKSALTYFDKDMDTKISAFQKRGFKFKNILKDSKGDVIGAEVISPEGQTIFLFKGQI